MKKLLIPGLLILFVCIDKSYCQDTARSTNWFPRGNLYPTIRLDHRESQISGSLYAMHASNQWQNRAFGIFSLGLRSNLVRWGHAAQRASELGFELCAYTQFIFEDPFRELETSLFNIDFKIGVHYQYKLERWRFRGRLYHLSSHLGDDFLIRNRIEGFKENSRIYEVVEFSAAWENRWWQLYATPGIIIHSAYPRKPFLGQTGVQFVYPIGEKDWIRWVGGADLKIEQELDFRPGLHFGAGIGIGKKRRFPFTIMADYYNGFLPYSLFDRIAIQWVGLSLWFDPF